MEYTNGKIGRVFLLKFSHGDDLLEGIKKVARDEDIKFATINLLGAVSKGDIVTGPKKTELPAVPNTQSIAEAREVVGFGVISFTDEEPLIHFHGAFGNSDGTLVGCLRGGGEVFVTIEAVIQEILDVNVKREKDEATGCALLNLGKN